MNIKLKLNEYKVLHALRLFNSQSGQTSKFLIFVYHFATSSLFIDKTICAWPSCSMVLIDGRPIPSFLNLAPKILKKCSPCQVHTKCLNMSRTSIEIHSIIRMFDCRILKKLVDKKMSLFCLFNPCHVHIDFGHQI